MTPQREEALLLLRLAARDRDTALLLAPLPAAHVTAIGFHAQQCVEKSLKAVAALQSIEYRRTHDLVALSDRLRSAGVLLPIDSDGLRKLNPYAVEVRYDDEWLPAVPRDQIVGMMSLVFSWASERVESQ